MKPILVVKHAEIEGPATLGAALTALGCELVAVRPDLGEPLPDDLADYAALIVMGGLMSATTDDGFPARRAELSLLRTALADAVPTLGICLGAEMLAAAADAKVYAGPEPEIGWRPVTLTPAAVDDPLLGAIDGPIDVLCWHGDTFDLPPDAVHLASSAQYPNQAFRVGPNAWGLQFHVEVDEDAVELFLATSSDTIPGGPAAIREGLQAALPRLREVQKEIATRFHELA